MKETNSTAKKQSFFRSNPVINRLNKVEERAAYDEKSAGYGRITVKTAFFLLVTVAGMMAYLVMKATIFANQPEAIHFNYKGFEVSTSGLSGNESDCLRKSARSDPLQLQGL